MGRWFNLLSKDMRKTKIGVSSFDGTPRGKVVKLEASNLQTVKRIGDCCNGLSKVLPVHFGELCRSPSSSSGQLVPRAASPRQGWLQWALQETVAGPWQSWAGSHKVDKRQTNRHAMQREVGYLFSGLWKGGERRKRDRETGKGEKWGETEAASLRKGLKLKISLARWMVNECAGLSLKGTEQSITSSTTHGFSTSRPTLSFVDPASTLPTQS